MNPFKNLSPMNNLMQMLKQSDEMIRNPSMVGKMLLDNGRIDEGTYNIIKDMKSPSEIGNYLLNNGFLGSQQVQYYANIARQMQKP